MKSPSNLLYPFCQIMTVQKVLLFCAVILMINGMTSIAFADEYRDMIIGFHKLVGLSEKALIHSQGGLAKKSFHLIPAIAARVPVNKIEELKKDPRIAYVEDDMIFRTADEYTSSWGVQHIGSKMVHDQGINGTGVKIAILDTGIDYTHEDLDANYKGGYDFVFDDADPFDDSIDSQLLSGHGTHVAGIIAAENNGVGAVGVAPNADIYAVKVLDGSGSGYASWIIDGIQWAVDNQMNIATMSIQLRECTADCPPGYNEGLQSMREAVDMAYSAGLLLVAAGGNTNGGNVSYPAAYDSVIAVTATDSADQRADFTSIGPQIELAAPGVDIYSTIGSGNYGYKQGTSMAAPHVTGVAALLISSGIKDVNNDGVADNKDVRKILQDTAEDLGDSGRDNVYGYGLVDAQRAVLGGESPAVNKLTLLKTAGTPISDSKSATLSHGNFSITVNNINLTKLEMYVYTNGILRKDLSYKNKFNDSGEVKLDLYVNSVFDLIFVPFGPPNSVGYVTITKK